MHSLHIIFYRLAFNYAIEFYYSPNINEYNLFNQLFDEVKSRE